MNTTDFPDFGRPRVKFNSGFWDGFHDAEANRLPLWNGKKHPWAVYEAGYQAGREAFAKGMTVEEGSSDAAWEIYQTVEEVKHVQETRRG